MGEPQQSIGAAFPAPPPFYKHFTEANISRYAEQVTGSATDPSTTQDAHSSVHSLLDLPPELRYLRPPSPPQDGKYRCFGEELELVTPLQSLPPETPLLYTSPPAPHHLIQLTRSILLNFLELLHILATNPAEYGPKWDDLRDLFRNAHQAINEYRPHQAREALILMMEAQVERGKREKEGMAELQAKVDEVLAGLREEPEINDGMNGRIDWGRRHSSEADLKIDSEEKMERERMMWDALRGISLHD